MKPIALFFMLCYALTLGARENPFQPVQTTQSQSLSKPILVVDFEPKIISVVKEENSCKTPPQKPPQKEEIKSVWKQVVATTQKSKRIKKFKKKYKKPKFRLIYKDENLKIYIKSRYIKIITNKKIQKSFFLKSPYRLVLDFQDDFFIYDSILKRVGGNFIKELKLGTHELFFRLTFVLKRSFDHKITRLHNGYLIKLR